MGTGRNSIPVAAEEVLFHIVFPGSRDAGAGGLGGKGEKKKGGYLLSQLRLR